MITSRQKQFLSEILERRPIPEDTLVYFRERLRDRLHSAILAAFQKRATEGLKQSDLADRINKQRAQITYWFSTPNNLTIDTISDLMVGLGMDFDAFPFTPIEKTVAVAAKEEKRERREAEPPSLLSMLGTNTKLTLDDLTELNKTLKSWMEETQSGSGSGSTASVPSSPSAGATPDATKTLQKQAISRKVIPLEEYRPKAVGKNANTLLQIGAR
jgi:hypothetical protein